MGAAAYDVAIVGAGPNGLTAAAYLARAGARVVLLEKRFERGGTFATDDYSTPYQYNIAQFELPLGEELAPFRDLDLHSQGLRFVAPESPFSARAEPGGPELVVGRGGRGLGGEVERMLSATSAALMGVLYRPPPEDDELRAQLGQDVIELAAASPRELAGLAVDPRAGVVLRYACGLAGFLDGDAPLGLIGAFAVARSFDPVIVAGGTKNLANALARVAAAAGARALVSCPVTAIERMSDGLVCRTAEGQEIGARAVISTLDPRSTFLDLLGDELAPRELQSAAQEWTVEQTASFTAHYGIKGKPPLPAGGTEPDALVRVFGFGAAAEIERHFDAAVAGRMPGAVAGHLSAVSAHDPLQASPGPYGPLHVLRLQTLVPFVHPEADWERTRVAYRRHCWEVAVHHFAGLEQAQLLFEFCDTPRDIERRFTTTRRGSIRQGSLAPGQTLTRRPHPSCSSGRTPVAGLYLGGGCVHPGVPGSLAAGHNAAAVVAEDLGLPWAPCT